MKLKAAALALVGVLAAGSLGACSSGADQAEPADKLIIGALGSTGDTLDPLTTQGFADYIGIEHLYRSIARLSDGEVELDLAESVEPNDDATEWTITLKDGQTFSDGSPITARDVAASLRLLADPDKSMNYAQFFSDIDAAAISEVDQRTVTVPLKRPRADFLSTALAFASYVVKDGATDWQQPVASGEYTLAEYSAGERLVLRAREDLGEDTPSIRELEVRVINDPQARLNALQSGEIDVATRVDPVMAQTVADDDSLTVSSSGPAGSQVLGFEMNVTQKPFDNPKVREAMRIGIDRAELVDTILYGEGEVGNDLVGKGLPGYAELPQRPYDPDKARALFAEAGVTELTIRAADTTPGLVDASELVAEQLGELGVEVTVDRTDPAAFYADFDTLLNTPLQTTYYINRDAAAFIGAFTGSFGYFNISGYNPPGYDDKVHAAQGTVDDAARTKAFDELQQMQYDDGGMILWGYQTVLNLQVSGLDGVAIHQGVPDFSAATLQE